MTCTFLCVAVIQGVESAPEPARVFTTDGGTWPDAAETAEVDVAVVPIAPVIAVEDGSLRRFPMLKLIFFENRRRFFE